MGSGLLTLLIAALLLTLLLVKKQQISSSNAQVAAQCSGVNIADIPPATPSGSFKDLTQVTQDLRQQNNNGLAALLGNPQEERQNIRDLAQKRKAYLLQAMQQNPREAYTQILPPNDRQTIARETQNCIEQEASISGTLEMHVVDYTSRPDRTLYFVRTKDDRRVRFYPTRDLPAHIMTGSKISAQGYMLDNNMLVDTSNPSNFAASTTSGSIGKIDSIGDQKLIVILANFQNTTQPSLDRNTVNSTVFTDVNNFYKDVSLGKTSWSGNLLPGWIPLPINSTCTDLVGIENAVIQAVDPQVDFNNYHRLLVFAPYGSNCQWKGESTIGEGMATTQEGQVPLSMSLVNADSDVLQIVGHELGHSLGLGHAGTLVCTPFGSTSCTLDEYADPYSIMGNIGLGMNAFDKETLGWLGSGNVQTITASGSYTISPLETATSGPMVLKIPTPDNNFLYVSYRQPIGVDATYKQLDPNTNVYTGALLHIQEPLNKSALLLTAPNIVGLKHALQLNQSYTYSGIKITVTGVTSTALTAQVTIPGSVSTTPTPGPTDTLSVTPTLNPVPTQTAGDSGFSFAISLALGGIDGSNTPLHLTRGVTLQLFNSAMQQAATYTGDVTYDSSQKIFTGVIPGTSLSPGLYTIKAIVPGYLHRLYPVPIQYSSATQFTLPELSLTGGDVNGDNRLNIIDYQLIIDCYTGSLGTCNDSQRQNADLNDDGKVDQIDYNIFLRQLTVHNGD